MIPLAIGLGLGSLAGGLFGGAMASAGQRDANRTNLAIAREQNALNYKMFQEQNQVNRALWMLQNQYNTPLAQRQRLEQAGINPAIALGQISTGQAGTISSATPAPAVGATMQNEQAGLAQGIQSGVNGALGTFADVYSRNRQMSMQERLIESQVNKNNVESVRTALESKALPARQQAELKAIMADTLKKQEETNRIKEITPLDKQRLEQDIKQSQSQEALNRVEESLRRYNLTYLKPLERKQLISGLSHTRAMIANLAKQGYVLDNQAQYLIAQKLESQARASGIRIENDTLGELLNIQVKQAYEDLGVTRANQRYLSEKADNAKYDVAFGVWDRMLNTVNTAGNLFKLGSSEMVTYSESVDNFDADGNYSGGKYVRRTSNTGRR